MHLLARTTLFGLLGCNDPSESDGRPDHVTTNDSGDHASPTDADSDGYVEADDCDDSDPNIHPDALESCNGIDEDCDGEVDDDPSDGTIWYADEDADQYGDDARFVVECVQPDRSVAAAGDCDDTEATVFPGAEEICDDGQDNDCVIGGSEACRTKGTLDGEDAFQLIPNDTLPYSAGFSPDLATAGDVNGDEQTDLLVGLDRYHGKDGQSPAGAALVCAGPLTELEGLSTCTVLASRNVGGSAGSSVTGLRDVDEDGYDDIFIGDPIPVVRDFDDAPGACAYGYVFYGPVTGSAWIDEADITIAGCADWSLGTDAAPGPITGGHRTLLVGASSTSDIPAKIPVMGSVYIVDPILAGKVDPALGFGAITAWRGERAGDRVGEVVHDLGDVDGDGVNDFGAASQSLSDEYGEHHGLTYVVTGGGPTGLQSFADADAIFDFAYSFGPARDHDGDGLDDILVTSSTDQTVRLFLGPLHGAIDVTAAGTEEASFPIPLHTDLDANDPIGVDVDGDAMADIAFSNPRLPEQDLYGGLWVQYAPASGVVSMRDMDLMVTIPNAGWESSLENVGDVDFDGHEDLIVTGLDFELFLLLGEGV
jgi:hypothetical protein